MKIKEKNQCLKNKNKKKTQFLVTKKLFLWDIHYNWPIIRAVCHKPMLSLVLFNILMIRMMKQSKPSVLVQVTQNFRGVTGIPENNAVIQRDLSRSDKYFDSNLM